MSKYFIPLDNNVDKLIAFTPSLDKEWRQSQRIQSKSTQIETLDAVTEFQRQGWLIDGAYEQRNSSRKISNHYVRMKHPDFVMKDKKGKNEALANIILSSSTVGTGNLEIDLGVYRLVCSNGLISRTSYGNAKIPHTEKGMRMFDDVLTDMGIKAFDVLDEFNKLKNIELDPKKAMALASEAARLRFGNNTTIDASQLLNIIRTEDEGMGLWEVYNRIQENLTQSNRLISNDGVVLGGVSNAAQDIRLNQQLTELVFEYA
jgi:hypothetical protein